MNQQYVFVSSPLALESLVCLLFPSSRFGNSFHSDFNLATLSCRQLVFEFSGLLLACPRTEENAVMVVCSSSLASSPQFFARCHELKLNPGARNRLHLSTVVLEECLVYTFRARLSPAWNKVGDLLLGGRQFLHQTDQIPAVKLAVHLVDGHLELVISASVVRFPLLQPDDLGIYHDSLERFMMGDCTSLTRDNFGRQQVVVLPSLTPATLLSVTKQRPESSTSRSMEWNTTKRCWKCMHGYRLEPEDGSEPMVYYTVSFGNGPAVTFPEWVVRRSGPRPVLRSDPHSVVPRSVVEQFLRELQASNPRVCGQVFSVGWPLAVRPSGQDVAIRPCLAPDLTTPKLSHRREAVTTLAGTVHSLDRRREHSGYETESRLRENVNEMVVNTMMGARTASKQAVTIAPINGSSNVKKPVDSSVFKAPIPNPLIPRGFATSILPPSTGTPSSAGDCPTFLPAGGRQIVPRLLAKEPKPTFLSHMVATQTNPSLGPSPRVTEAPRHFPIPISLSAKLTAPGTASPTTAVPSSPPPRLGPNTSQSARKKPLVQNVDLAQLVRHEGSKGLAKVNCATLLDHLRRQGVAAAKVKSKKEELVQMVVSLYQ